MGGFVEVLNLVVEFLADVCPTDALREDVREESLDDSPVGAFKGALVGGSVEVGPDELVQPGVRPFLEGSIGRPGSGCYEGENPVLQFLSGGEGLHCALFSCPECWGLPLVVVVAPGSPERTEPPDSWAARRRCGWHSS